MADFVAELFVRRVDFDAKSARAKFVAHVGCVRELVFGDRRDDGLNGREPRGERAAEMFDEHAEETLERARECAVNHHGRVVAAVRSAIREIEALREHEVDLDRSELPAAADRVVHVDVELRSVEGSPAGIDRIRQPARCERPANGVFRDIVRWETFVCVARGEHVFDVLKTERTDEANRFVRGRFELALKLFGRAEEMRVVLREAANAREAVQRAAALVAIDGTEFGIA